VAALYLLSPTQFPWYYLWLLPFLTIHSQISFLLLTPLLSLYYMRFYFTARGMANIHDNGIVWVQFVPVWMMLIREWIRGRQRSGFFAS
jgi:alpha-1,6-mannosyltransferase